jgi:thiol-disulfide isomerase/thioredoxin
MRLQRLAAIVLTVSAALASPARAASGPAWSRDADGAFAAARQSGRLLLVDAYADWCGWCKKLEREVFPHPAFRELARDLVLLRVDVEDGGEGTELAETYGATSLPTLILLEPSGTFVGSVSGFAPAVELVRRVRAEIAGHERTLAAFAQTLAVGDAQALESAGLDRWRRRDGARAAAALEKLLSIASLPPEGEAWNRYLLADAWRLAGELERARSAAAAAERARARAGETDAELAERLALLPFWIAEGARDCGAAAGRLAAFERSHPSSPLLGEAHRAMARLRADAGPLCA